MSRWLTRFLRVASSERRSVPFPSLQLLPFVSYNCCNYMYLYICATIVMLNVGVVTFYSCKGKSWILLGKIPPCGKHARAVAKLLWFFSVTNHKNVGWCGGGGGYQIHSHPFRVLLGFQFSHEIDPYCLLNLSHVGDSLVEVLVHLTILGASIYDVRKMLEFFDPLPPSQVQKSADFVPFVCFTGTPRPSADLIYGRPLSREFVLECCNA